MKQYRIDELLANGEQWFAPLDEETFDALAGALAGHGDAELTVPIVLSERGRLLDGHHRLMALQRAGRKVITEADVRVDHTATDPETEALAAIAYQFRRRQLGTPEKAKLARDLMRRFGWSQATIAKQLGVSRPAVTQWLTAHPDPSWTPPDTITGEDGKTYTVTPGPEPKAKPARPARDYTPAVVVEDYVAQLCSPGWGQWINQWAATAPAEERHAVAEGLKLIATSSAMLAEHLTTTDGAGEDGDGF